MQQKAQKTNQGLVSVVIPIFNGNSIFINDSLNSIRDQTYTNFECIIIDDSTDMEIITMLKKYCKKNQGFKYIGRFGRDGLGAALNCGMKICKGQFIARMDSDDLSVNDRLATQVKFLTDRVDIDIVGSQMTLIDHDGVAFGYKKYQLEHDDIVKHFGFQNALGHPSVMFKRKLVEAGNSYDQNFRYCEDLELWLRLLRKGYKFANIERSLIYYREDRDYERGRDNWIYNWKARRQNFSPSQLYSYLSIGLAFINLFIPDKLRLVIYKILTR